MLKLTLILQNVGIEQNIFFRTTCYSLLEQTERQGVEVYFSSFTIAGYNGSYSVPLCELRMMQTYIKVYLWCGYAGSRDAERPKVHQSCSHF